MFLLYHDCMTEDYQPNYQNTSRKVARAVLLHDSHILLIKRHTATQDFYALPGGGVEADESFEHAVVRELNEEASIVAAVERLVYVYTSPKWGKQRFYKCQYISGEPLLRADSIEAQIQEHEENSFTPMWVDVTSLSGLAVYPSPLVDQLIKDIASGFAAKVQHFTDD